MAKKVSYLFEAKVFSWDSDHYKEYDEQVAFDSLDELNKFCSEFVNLPIPTYKMPYFGKFKEIEYYNILLCTYGKFERFDGGGISTSFKKVKVTVEEEPI